MPSQPFQHPRFPFILLFFFLSASLLAACAGGSVPSVENPTLTSTLYEPTLFSSHTAPPSLTPTSSSTPSITPSLTHTSTPSITPTHTRTSTPSATPEPLPIFTTKELRPGVLPLSYLANTCFYLSQRWALDASPPGTVVVPVMFHSIYKTGRNITDPKDIPEDQFQAFVQYARYLGFETITTAQLIDFLEHNAPIPPRSMILILDDRRPGVVREHFLPVLEENNWSLTLAYIADPNSLQWAMKEVQQLYTESGRLDVQSHGYTGQLYITDQTTAEEIRNEIWQSTQALEDNFGQRPLAFIWPGGNFTALAVQIAREGGYRLGFSAYSRGPLMFNWVPQGELEQAIGDPLMLLPRAWSNSVNVNLDVALRISQQAVDSARQQYAAESAYYRTYCNAELPPLGSILP